MDTDASIAALSDLGRLRVWSVIVTFFGDSVLPRGGTATTTALGAIAGRLGIEPSALRVALHRLVRDGWLTRTREGRRSLYRLSAQGMDRFASARRRIYAPAPTAGPSWTLAIAPERVMPVEAPDFTPIAPGAWLGTGAAPEGAFAITGDLGPLPQWLREVLGPPDLAADYSRLAGLLENITEPPSDPLGATALRTLLIHHWRRLLLRHPDLPERFFPDHWKGETCRRLVLTLHARLSPAADAWLDEAVPASGRGT